jgi:hypothetical protein
MLVFFPFVVFVAAAVVVVGIEVAFLEHYITSGVNL